MGDLIEFTTWPQHQHVFYKITSGAVSFLVKGETHAAVGLAKRPGKKCDFWVIIGNVECWIEKEGSNSSTITDVSNNIMSNNTCTRFWITWHGCEIKLGGAKNGVPIVSKTILSAQDIQFITFSSYENRGPLQWKVFLPPKLEKPYLKKVVGGEMKWVKAGQRLPPGALIGGYENEILYIIRAEHLGSLTPGKFIPSLEMGFYPWRGEVYSDEASDLEVLCGYNCIWVSTCSNKIPVGAVEGGYSEDDHEILYIGRALEQGNLIPGKVQPSHSVCYIPYGSCYGYSEIAKEEYEILVNPQISMQSPNRYLPYQIGEKSELAEQFRGSWHQEDAHSDVVWEIDEAECQRE